MFVGGSSRISTIQNILMEELKMYKSVNFRIETSIVYEEAVVLGCAYKGQMWKENPTKFQPPAPQISQSHRQSKKEIQFGERHQSNRRSRKSSIRSTHNPVDANSHRNKEERIKNEPFRPIENDYRTFRETFQERPKETTQKRWLHLNCLCLNKPLPNDDESCWTSVSIKTF